jgi:hypothetical protein
MKVRNGFLSVVATAVLLISAGCGDGETDQDTAPESSVTSAPPTTVTTAASAQAVKFLEPADGAKVTSPVKVRMDAIGFTIEPAGEVKAAAGHFHIIVDGDCVATGEVIPKDDKNLHYGMAQTEAELTLTAGNHTLCLQAGDGAHTALDLTHTIAIEVQRTGY